jgi:hypothetical protein
MQNSKLETSKKTEQTGRGPLRRQRSILDCSAIEEEEKKYVCFILLTAVM